MWPASITRRVAWMGPAMRFVCAVKGVAATRMKISVAVHPQTSVDRNCKEWYMAAVRRTAQKFNRQLLLAAAEVDASFPYDDHHAKTVSICSVSDEFLPFTQGFTLDQTAPAGPASSYPMKQYHEI